MCCMMQGGRNHQEQPHNNEAAEPEAWWTETLDEYLYDYDYFIPEEADSQDVIYDPLIRMGMPCPINGCDAAMQFLNAEASRKLLQNTGFGVGETKVVGNGGIPPADYTPYTVSHHWVSCHTAFQQQEQALNTICVRGTCRDVM